MSNYEILELGSKEELGKEADRLWCHMKTGGIYKIVTYEATIEATLTRAVVYQSLKDATIWIRPFEEFMDGRFVKLSRLRIKK